MNRDDYLKLHESLCKEALELSTRKNHDYAGRGGEQPFANFERCEAMGICTTGQGFLVRMTDKLSRLASFEQAGEFKVKDESIKDTVLDIINYAALYYAQKQSKAPAVVCAKPEPVIVNDRDHSDLAYDEVVCDCVCPECNQKRRRMSGSYRIRNLD